MFLNVITKCYRFSFLFVNVSQFPFESRRPTVYKKLKEGVTYSVTV